MGDWRCCGENEPKICRIGIGWERFNWLENCKKLNWNYFTNFKIWETKIRQMGVATFPPLEGNQQQYQQQKHFHGVSNEEGLYLPHSNPANGT